MAFVLRLVGAPGAGGELVAGGEVAFDDLVERDASRHRQGAGARLFELGAESGELPFGGQPGAVKPAARLDHLAGDRVLAQVDAHPPDAGGELDERPLSVPASGATRGTRVGSQDRKLVFN